MNAHKDPRSDLDQNPTQEVRPVDESRRSLAKAGLAAPAVLATLLSRPVLADVCPTPSAAGSGNLSQHPKASSGACTGLGANNPGTFAVNGSADKKFDNQLPAYGYQTNDPFHPLFTGVAGNLYVMVWNNKNQHGSGTRSMTLNEVLKGAPPADEQATGFNMGTTVAGYSMAQWFVAALLGSATGLFGNPPVLPPTGEPSVKGIEDEFARKSVYEYTATKTWDALKIVQYFQDPWSML